MKEVWKTIKDYKNYQVSNLGRVKSKRRNTSKNKYEDIILKPALDRHGYKRVHLYKKGKNRTFQVHRLVAQAFIPNPKNKQEINHLDYNPSNNRVDNLEWATRTENCRYSLLNNSLGQLSRSNTKRVAHYIEQRTKKCFRFQMIRAGKIIESKSFSTLKDAICYRNEWLKNNMIDVYNNLRIIENL